MSTGQAVGLQAGQWLAAGRAAGLGCCLVARTFENFRNMIKQTQ